MIEDIKKELESLKDNKYADFSKKLIPNVDNIIGVRLPNLRKLASKIALQDYHDFFKENDDEYMEQTMLEGMVIGKIKDGNIKKYIENFIPKINNWAVCDSFCSGLKCFSKDKDKLFLEKYFKSEKEFEIRFAYVILLNYFVNCDYEYVISKVSEFNNDAYYAKMAAAWCLSYCIIKHYKRSLNDLKTLKFHPFVYKKGITKAIESYRLTKIQKDELRKFRNAQDF